MREGTELNKKLDQYAVMAKGRATEGRSLAEIAGYAAAAGASLGLAGTADAAIIYSGVLNQSVMVPTTAASTAANLSFSMNGGNGFSAVASFAASAFRTVTTSGLVFGSSFVRGRAGIEAKGVAAFLGVNPSADKLNAGATISAGGVFNASFGGNQRTQTFVSSNSAPTFSNFVTSNPFANALTAFVGIKLGTGATANYGWIRLILEDLGDNPVGTLGADGANYFDKVTIVDWAYDDTGAAITAGATSVDAPDSLALLALGATGIAAFRRRKAEKVKPA